MALLSLVLLDPPLSDGSEDWALYLRYREDGKGERKLVYKPTGSGDDRKIKLKLYKPMLHLDEQIQVQRVVSLGRLKQQCIEIVIDVLERCCDAYPDSEHNGRQWVRMVVRALDGEQLVDRELDECEEGRERIPYA